MLDSVLQKNGGRIAATALAIAAIAFGIYVVKGFFVSSVVADERSRVFIDATTMKGFRHELVAGESLPIVAPSGNKSGYPAELCYWTKDGKPKADPTPVLLNSWVGKPGPTFCPDCGRLVVPNNPPATPGGKPPPTEEEYNQKSMSGVGPELLHAVAITISPDSRTESLAGE